MKQLLSSIHLRDVLSWAALAGFALVTVTALANNGVGNGSNKNKDTGQSSDEIRIGGTELGTAYYHIKEDLSLDDVVFTGPTVIVADQDVTVDGNASVLIGAEVIIYFAGDFTMSGKASINNMGRPANFQLIGTREIDDDSILDKDRQQVTMNGNVDFAGVVYAPEAIFTSNGGGGKGAYFGAITAYNATFNGVPGPFHYDESLGRVTLPDIPFETSGYRTIRDPEQLVNNDPKLGTYENFIDGFFE
ncbi:MAG: DUF7305 domain-containing protein [Puniceicoccales bacterium]